jgi:hypothetical protein
LLWVGLALFLKRCLMFLKKLRRFFKSILRVLAIDAFVIKLGCRSFDLGEYFEHVVGRELSSSDERKEEGSMWCQSSV